MASDTTAAQHQQLTPATTAAMATPHVASMVPTPPQAQTQTEQQQRPASSQSSPFPVMVVAQHDFPGTGEDEISFQRGDLIVVIAKDDGFGDGWWTGRTPSNQIGLFPAIYTSPYIPPLTPNPTEPRPSSQDSPADTKKRSFSSGESEGVYEGLGIHSDQAYAVDNPLNQDVSDVDETLGELSLRSSPSSLHTLDLDDQKRAGDEYTTEDDSSISSGSTNPILAQIRRWTPEEVAAFLVDRGFPNQAPNFVRHEISGAILLELDLAMLKEVDIVAFGVRFQIMREIEGLRRLAAPSEEKRSSRQRRVSRDSGPHLPLRSPARSITSGEEDNIPPLRSPPPTRSSHTSPTVTPPPFASRPRHHRQSSYEPTTPRSTTASPRPLSMSQESGRLSQTHVFDPRRSSKPQHRSTQSQDSGFGGSTPDLHPQTRPPHFRSKSSSTTTGTDGPYQSGGRIRVDSQDSGLGHSRHTSTDTIIRSPAKSGHKRQSSSTVTVRAQPPSIPLMEAPGVKVKSQDELPLPPSVPTNGNMTFPGTRSETPPNRPTAKFLITPNSTRSPVLEKEMSVNGTTETGVRLVKSYGQLRRRSLSTVESPSTPIEEGVDLHSHRSILLRNVSAKDASATADYSGWLRKRTERGQSIAGLGGVGPGVGMVGGWKKRWFVLKGRRLSYYHSDKEKGVIDITAHKCVTAVSAPNPSSSPTEGQSSTGPTRKISLTGSSKFIFKVVPPAPGTSRAVTFTPQKIHIFSAENETDFRGWVEALMKANIGLDTTAPVISSSTVPLISLARAKELKSRPPALDLSDSRRSTSSPHPASYVVTSDGAATKSTKPQGEPKSPPLPTPPLARHQSGDSKGNFEMEMEKALGKVGKTPEIEKKQQLLELSIPIGLN